MKLPPPNTEASAQGMIRNFGKNAAMEALHMADRYAEKHDQEGYRTWLSIAAAIEAIRPFVPISGADQSVIPSELSAMRHKGGGRVNAASEH